MDPPSISNTAFQEALQRARKLAAKISIPPNAAPGGQMKRPYEDEDDNEYGPPDSKRASYDQIGSQMPSMNRNAHSSRPPRGQLFLDGYVCDGEKTLDMMIAGNKVGFIIGKGGAGIRGLQDKAGVRMVIYQDSAQSSDEEKQLRITGPPDKVDYAARLVNDLLLEKENEQHNRMMMRRDGGGGRDRYGDGPPGGRMGNQGMNEYGASSRMTFFEYPVSPQLIGLVIGKGGETIRKIQAESGCKVQFDTAKLDAQGNKICQFTGTQEAVNKAVELVKEIVDTISGHGGGGGGGGQNGVEEIRLIVPASRTGSVIGRGGETIRQFKQQSCCNIELDKSFHSDNDEKCFIIRGPADKVGYAQQLVTDKVGAQVSVLSSTIPQFNNDDQYGYLSGQIYANQVIQGQSSSASSVSDQYNNWPQAGAADGGSNNLQAQQSAQEQYAMWAAYCAQYYQQAQPQAVNSATGQDGQMNDEAIYKQWIEYYKACGMMKEAEQIEKSLQEYKNAQKQNSGNDDRRNDDGKSNHGSAHHHHSRKNGESD